MATPRLTASRPHNYEWVIKPAGHVVKVPTTHNVAGPAMIDKDGGVMIRDRWRKAGFLALRDELSPEQYAKFVEYQEACTALRRRKKPANWAEQWDIEPTTGIPRDCIPPVVAERRGLDLDTCFGSPGKDELADAMAEDPPPKKKKGGRSK